VPEPKRRFGYYVLPLLLGDRLVARFDLKADRAASALRVRRSHVEPGVDPSEVALAAATELDAMRSWLGLTKVAVERRDGISTALRRARRTASGQASPA
jgi:uncharacterized protein YcaQ